MSVVKMSGAEFKKFYNFDAFLENDYTTLLEVTIYDGLIEYVQVMNLRHPDCPIVKFKGIEKC